MKFPNLGVLIRALAAAYHDARANAPRPAAPTAPMTGAEVLAHIEQVEELLPVIKAWLAAHPGTLTAADDLLDMLESQGFAWAHPLRAGVDSAPSALAAAGGALSKLDALLHAIQPAPVGLPGAWAGSRGHAW